MAADAQADLPPFMPCVRARGVFSRSRRAAPADNAVAAARLAADAFAEAGLCTLTYWEFPSLDHGMRTPDGTSRLAEVAALAADWVKAPAVAC